eukprot:SAG22_NODE_2369_length_2651_cov_8.167712_1_plen_214_part_10
MPTEPISARRATPGGSISVFASAEKFADLFGEPAGDAAGDGELLYPKTPNRSGGSLRSSPPVSPIKSPSPAVGAAAAAPAARALGNSQASWPGSSVGAAGSATASTASILRGEEQQHRPHTSAAPAVPIAQNDSGGSDGGGSSPAARPLPSAPAWRVDTWRADTGRSETSYRPPASRYPAQPAGPAVAQQPLGRTETGRLVATPVSVRQGGIGG